ncbi:DinB family protein [Cohnella sp. CFH 77786]|uniref:DinB family protein n=1 Tax=Cohnella sp. CFH 77786 TaxID=2662265 RepID=UPI001C60A94A|nr:DinB family protein [Cohnella sp. CFH 77786]MBW5445482.1 DinB family protein [Cohnella sp. CFH 77786]
MGDLYLFDQAEFVRKQTLKAMEGVTEEMADKIPDGFRNSIRWNLGHVYVVLERYIFKYLELPLHVPEGFQELFEFGTSPLGWPDSVRVPTLPELEALLAGQLARVREAVGHRLRDEVPQPYTTSLGMRLSTPEEFLSFNLYHEGMHLGAVKLYKKLLSC